MKRPFLTAAASFLALVMVVAIGGTIGMFVSDGAKTEEVSAGISQEPWETKKTGRTEEADELVFDKEIKIVSTVAAVPEETETESETETEPETKAETEAQTEAQTEPETQKETEAQTQAQTEPQTEAPKTEKTNNYYIIGDSSSRYLAEGDLDGKSAYDLMMARNEIYARKGRGFTDSSIQAYFDSQSWYSKKYSAQEFDALGNSLFNDYEYQNILTIRAYEEEKGY